MTTKAKCAGKCPTDELSAYKQEHPGVPHDIALFAVHGMRMRSLLLDRLAQVASLIELHREATEESALNPEDFFLFCLSVQATSGLLGHLRAAYDHSTDIDPDKTGVGLLLQFADGALTVLDGALLGRQWKEPKDAAQRQSIDAALRLALEHLREVEWIVNQIPEAAHVH